MLAFLCSWPEARGASPAVWFFASAAVAQAGGTGGDPQAESAQLLGQARRAIKDQQFEQADKLIAQAEKLGVQYDAFQTRFGDTPQSLRKLLADERSRAGGGAAKPSSLFPPLFGGAKPLTPPGAPPAEPFASTGVVPAAAAGQQNREDAVNLITDSGKARALALVRDGRAALARGETLAAVTSYQKALALKAQFAPNEDSPARLADELTKAGVNLARYAPPVNADPTAPFRLSPADINPADERLPLLPNATAGPPAAAQQNPVPASPFALPAETNPLSGSPAFATPADSPFKMPGDAPVAGVERLPVPDVSKKGEAERLATAARFALAKGDLTKAQALAAQAEQLGVPDEAFGPGEVRPWQVSNEVNAQLARRQGVTPAGGAQAEPKYPVAQGVFDPSKNIGGVVTASSQQPLLDPPAVPAPAPAAPLNPVAAPAPAPAPAAAPGFVAPFAAPAAPAPSGNAQAAYDEGLRFLDKGDTASALAKFREANRQADQLDPEIKRQLRDKLTYLQAAPPAAPVSPVASQQPGAEAQPVQLERVDAQQDLLRQKLQREILNEKAAAEKLAQTDPRAALGNMQKLRDRIAATDAPPASRKVMLTSVDSMIRELETYISANKGNIENSERNRAILEERARNQELTIEMQNKLADMVEQFNKLLEEERFMEAEVIAKQAREMAPDYPVVTVMVEKARLVGSLIRGNRIRERSANGFSQALESVDESGIPFDDREPFVFNARRWSELTRRRKGLIDGKQKMSTAEQDIYQSLSKTVQVQFENRPLAEVLDMLAQMTGVNLYIDSQGLHAEAVSTDDPVTIKLRNPISLRSALDLILQPRGLSYVIQNDVLRITSRQTRDTNVYAKVYYVADLVVPIPNFSPTYNMGLAGALRESLNSLSQMRLGGFGAGLAGGPAPLTTAGVDANQNTAVNPTVLGQQALNGGGSMMHMNASSRSSIPAGPGGLGGGPTADFGPLIDLITSTIEPDSWQEVGGPGSIEGFETNLSLVVAQRQDIHEKIADLLEQLRRLQDLQVTIEVRFITVSDRFFERIGIDFDFDIDDNTGLNNRLDLLPNGDRNGNFDDQGKSYSFGLLNTDTPTTDLDYQFRQGGFSIQPQFGGFDAGSAANFGFAILSDIEVFFLLQAAQGDDRTNVLQAPKVTLFNGQSATVIDSSFRPFVTSVVPVVGDFAAAYQPVVVVLSEGTMMNVQAVVSADRRYVRLTLVPFFSQIGDVDTFTFEGEVTTNTGTTIQDPANPDGTVRNGETRTVRGTTVQLPTLATTTVTTTVSVPDGGTVLLGGIKRLREGRGERGVPLLSKVPYVSRLFKNVAIGRDAQSLMLMVTPRIIIQEEEEEKLGIESEQN